VFDGTGNINQNNFIFDEKQNVLLAKYGNKGKPVLAGSYAKIKILAMMIEKKSHKINVVASLEAMATSIPVGFVGDPGDFGEAVAFLASQQAKFITGASINIDGGQFAGLQ
jgi:NAD(P)-dependent dehydrogenase (short-subunit alcohol dehydrogenase family)